MTGHIGRYTILQEIGRGGMGVVYRCHDEAGEPVAIKVLLDHASATEAQRRRFVREAEALQQLDHPALIKVRHHGQQGEHPYLVLDFLPGTSLGDHLEERGALPPREAVELLAQIADGLAHAHARGVVHRDIKPDNVRLSPEGHPVLLDFGLAKSIGLAHSRLTQTGHMLGTPGFWAPEQMAGELDRVGPHSDVYALGATLYMTLTGRPPFEGKSLVEIALAALRPPPPPSKLVPGLDASLEAICLRCLAHDPGERYADGAAIRDALRDWLAREPPAEAAPALRRGPLLAGAALALLLGGLAAGGALDRAAEPADTATAAPVGPLASARPDPTPAPSPSASPAAPTPSALRPLDPEEDARIRARLLAGVEEIPLGSSVPGPVIAFGPRAFVVLTAVQNVPAPFHRAFVAAARFGAGRVVAYGHEFPTELVTPEQVQTARLLRNVADWAGLGPVALLGGDRDRVARLTAILERPVRLVPDVRALGGARLVVWARSGPAATSEERVRLVDHVRQGGGLIVGRCPWGRQQLLEKKQPGYDLRDDLPANQVLAPMGLIFDPLGHLRSTAPAPRNAILVAANQAEDAHAGAALEAAFGPRPSQAQALHASRLVRTLPAVEQRVLPRVRALAQGLSGRFPRPDRPARVDLPLRIYAQAAQRAWEVTPPEEVAAAPGVEQFPGSVPAEVERVEVRLLRDRRRPWTTIAAYAPPGEVIAVTVDPLVPGWWIRIGAHPDRAAERVWPRWPRVELRRELTRATTRLASPYGGLIYLSYKGNLRGPKCRVTLRGVVTAPTYITQQGWVAREAGAPWGQLTAPGVRLTAPADLLRQVPDPEAVLRAWTQLLVNARGQLPAPRGDPGLWLTFERSPPPVVRATPPRPLPLPLAEPGSLPPGLDPQQILRRPEHLRAVALHLTRGWVTPRDANMVTVLLTLSLSGPQRWRSETIQGLVRQGDALRRRTDPRALDAAFLERIELVFPQLYELDRAFGWAVFRAALQRLAKRTRFPTKLAARRDLWVEALSRAANRNLVPFFRDRWGRPVGEKTAKRLAKLSPWSPPR